MVQETGNDEFSDLLVVKDPQVLRRFLALVGTKKKPDKNDDGYNNNNDGNDDPPSGSNGGNNNKPSGSGNDSNPTSPKDENNEGGDNEESDDDDGHDNGNNPHGGATEDAKTSALVIDGKNSPQDSSQPASQDKPSQQDFDLSAKACREMMSQAKILRQGSNPHT